MKQITITSDGTSQGTQVKFGDDFIKGVTKIEFNPMEIGGIVTAKITLNSVAIKMALKDAEIICEDAELAEKMKEVLKES
jgi:hypothetical protein